MSTLTESVLVATRNSPGGITTLDMLKSLKLCDDFTLKTTLSRISRSGRIIRLKRGTYSVNPIANAFASAQHVFNGYIGFSSALYLHKLIDELPFAISVVTRFQSGIKRVEQYEFRAIALGDKAVGFINMDTVTVSTRPKTLFDCLYLERYGIPKDKLIEAYKTAKLSGSEFSEFDSYVTKFIPAEKRQKFNYVRRQIAKTG
jgi:predicted transcriptional regulator of viral defense system